MEFNTILPRRIQAADQANRVWNWMAGASAVVSAAGMTALQAGFESSALGWATGISAAVCVLGIGGRVLPSKRSKLKASLVNWRDREVDRLRKENTNARSLELAIQGMNDAIDRIMRASDDGSKSLDLEGLSLPSFPPGLEKLPHLEELNLKGNVLTRLPSRIGALTGLRKLDLRNNRLKSLPSELGKLLELRELYLSFNSLENLPSEIGELRELKNLALACNNLSVLPPEIEMLTSLEELNLNRNDLRDLPLGIGNLTALKQLNLLGNEKLQALPFAIGKLTQLEKLDTTVANIPMSLANLPHFDRFKLSINSRYDAIRYAREQVAQGRVLEDLLEECKVLEAWSRGSFNYLSLFDLLPEVEKIAYARWIEQLAVRESRDDIQKCVGGELLAELHKTQMKSAAKRAG